MDYINYFTPIDEDVKFDNSEIYLQTVSFRSAWSVEVNVLKISSVVVLKLNVTFLTS